MKRHQPFRPKNEEFLCWIHDTKTLNSLPAEESVRVVPLFWHIHVEAFQPPLLGLGRVHGTAEALQKRR